MIRSRSIAVLASLALALVPVAPLPAFANGGFSGGKQCAGGGGVTINNPVTISKSISIYKPVTITKNINIDNSVSIYKPITINKSISIDNSVNIWKNISITKNIDLSKKIIIDKKIIINKGNGSAKADAFASAAALAFASARASSVSYGGGGYVEQATQNNSGEIGGVAVQEACVDQWATVVKAVHAICIDHWGKSHPATRMRPETWIDASYSGEIYRCLEGSSLRVIIGHVVESDEGVAAVYEGGDTLECKAGEALRHFADGLVKCAAQEPVPDCTERRNLRAWGAGDIFFSYQTKVCAKSYSASSSYSGKMSYGESHELELTGMSLNGGVGY